MFSKSLPDRNQPRSPGVRGPLRLDFANHVTFGFMTSLTAGGGVEVKRDENTASLA